MIDDGGDNRMQTWLERLIRFQQNYQKLMQGRYAKFDQLNRILLIIALFLVY